MIYSDLREIAKTGDIILLEGTGIVSRIIRVLTGQSISHVAALFWLDGGLFIAEMVEGVGYQIVPASQRLSAMKGIVYFGSAPKVVQDATDSIMGVICSYRTDKTKQGYGYLSLIKVWWAQIRRKPYRTRGKVCSTFVQELWESAGYHFDQLADPGDYVRRCRYVARLEL